MGSGQESEASAAGEVEQAPIELLFKAFANVADLYGTETKCVEACIMLYGIAKHLGYELKPRGVSVGINDFASGVSVILGAKILESLSPEAKAAAIDALEGGENLGHLILTMDDPHYLFDPNISQVNKLGANIPGICQAVEVTDGMYGLELESKSFSVNYVLDEDSRLLENFYELAARDGAHHREAAGWLRSGKDLGRSQG